MSWNGCELKVEAANAANGQREKIIIGFHDLPLEIQFALRENLTRAQAKAEELAARERHNANEASESRARASEVAKRVTQLAHEKAHAQAEAKWSEFTANLPSHIVAYHENKRELRRAKSLETSRQIYMGMAVTPGQGIDFANQMIEPARRPKRIEMTQNGNRVTYYPQTADNSATKKAKKAAAKAGVNVGIVDTSDFTF